MPEGLNFLAILRLTVNPIEILIDGLLYLVTLQIRDCYKLLYQQEPRSYIKTIKLFSTFSLFAQKMTAELSILMSL